MSAAAGFEIIRRFSLTKILLAFGPTACVFIGFTACNCNTVERKASQAKNKITRIEQEHQENVLAQNRSELQEGDLIFHTSRSAQSVAIQLVTQSKWSHCGLITFVNSNPFVLEAVEPVKLTALEAWIKRGIGRHYIVKRLKPSVQVLSFHDHMKLQAAAKTYIGKHYDLQFLWGNDRLYCSELIYKVYDDALGIQLTPFQHFRDFDLSHPEVQKKVRERYHGRVPIDEPVITPDGLYQSNQLEIVLSG